MDDFKGSILSTPPRKRLLHFSAVFVPVVLLFLLALGSVLYVDYTQQRSLLKEDESRLTTFIGVAIQNYVSNARDDLLDMARVSELINMDNGEVKSGQDLEPVLISFAQSHVEFDQLRVIDNTGQETVRVNYRGGNAVAVPQDELQDKSSRYYFAEMSDFFAEIIELDAGDVYITPLDLNVENGIVDDPVRPMIRLGTPIVDRNGYRYGYLAINLNGRQIVQLIRNSNARSHGEVSLLNRDGYWLVSPNQQDEWGFMYPVGREKTLARQDPKLWAEIVDNDRVNIDYQGQLYSRAPVCLDLSCRTTLLTSPNETEVIGALPASGLYIVTRVSAEALSYGALLFPELATWIPLFVLLGVICGVCSLATGHHS